MALLDWAGRLFLLGLMVACGANAADTCTISDGETGVCMTAAACSSSGGKSAAGSCSGSSDTQCCTYGSCSVLGLNGMCQPVSSCTSSGGTTHSGYCPGDSTIKCCTYGTCTAAGVLGTCLLESQCQTGGTLTAGLCSGPDNVECCTYGTCAVNGVNGTCQTTATCTGTYTQGLCSGPNNVQCCTPAGTGGGNSTSGGGNGTTSGCPPAVNNATLSLIEQYEGWSATEYADPDGNPTIGWGHLCSSATCSEIGYPIPLSLDDGAKLLQSDLQVAEKCLNKDISNNVTLNPNQYGALVSWAFNMGCGNAGSSTLVAELNEGQDPDTVASTELPKWVYGSNSEVLPGLVKRRAAEVQLFTTPVDGVAHPC